MDGQVLLRWAVPAAGVLLIALVLLDVFFTVLYARIGTGIISHPLSCGTWFAFRAVGKRLGRRRSTFLSFCGPVILMLLVTVWVWGLIIGGALIVLPKLGTSITATSGPTPRGFVTALYVAGDTMTTVGTSDLAPRTPVFRFLYTASSLVGISVITLTLTYFVEIYTSLQRRNTLALKVHLATAETGDAVEMVAGLGPQGRFDEGYSHLAEMGAEIVAVKESHHFYSVLVYFRFAEPHYALSRVALVTLDAVTLIKSALDDDKHAWLKESAAVEQLWRASMRMATLLADSFLPGGMPEPRGAPDEAARDRWRRRYVAALRRLREAGIETIQDEENGAETYAALRGRWDRYVKSFAEHMLHDLDTIDPAGTHPEAAEQRQPFETRLRSAG